MVEGNESTAAASRGDSRALQSSTPEESLAASDARDIVSSYRASASFAAPERLSSSLPQRDEKRIEDRGGRVEEAEGDGLCRPAKDLHDSRELRSPVQGGKGVAREEASIAATAA